MPQHPQRPEQERPEIEAVAHEREALGRRHVLVLARRRLVNREDGHLVLRRPARQSQPPSVPLVEGTSPAARGSIAKAARNARAKPLKQDSAIW